MAARTASLFRPRLAGSNGCEQPQGGHEMPAGIC